MFDGPYLFLEVDHFGLVVLNVPLESVVLFGHLLSLCNSLSELLLNEATVLGRRRAARVLLEPVDVSLEALDPETEPVDLGLEIVVLPEYVG